MKELSVSEFGGKRLTVKVVEDRKSNQNGNNRGFRAENKNGGYNRDRNWS